MARGAPDYSNITMGAPFHRVDDMGELAVRLGSPVVADRSGNVALVEDFRYGLSTLEKATAGLGEEMEMSPLYSRYGGFTVRLTRVGNVNSSVRFTDRVSVRQAGNVGAEVLFVIMTNRANVYTYLARHTGTRYMFWGLRWDGTTGKIYIGDTPRGWTDTGIALGQNYGYPLLHAMKLVASEDEVAYVRATIDGMEIPLPARDVYNIADTSTQDTMLSFYNGEGPTVISSVYVDAIIITTNEP